MVWHHPSVCSCSFVWSVKHTGDKPVFQETEKSRISLFVVNYECIFIIVTFTLKVLQICWDSVCCTKAGLGLVLGWAQKYFLRKIIQLLQKQLCQSHWFILFCVLTGRWWMPGLLSAFIPSSLLCPKKILHSSNSLQISAPHLPPPSSHLPSASWRTARPHLPQSPAQLLAPQLAKSQLQSLTVLWDPSWSKTLKVPWLF